MFRVLSYTFQQNQPQTDTEREKKKRNTLPLIGVFCCFVKFTEREKM